ncbi:MAG: hypothetical protein ABFS38_16125 [Bacteroidota bacterium]
MLKTGIPILILLLFISPAYSQSLFESSTSKSAGFDNPQSLSIGGYIRSLAYIGRTPIKEDPYFQSAYSEAGLLLKAEAGSWAYAKTDIRFRYGTEWQKNISEMDIREAYVALTTGPAGFRFGKMITPWGKGSVFNPTDKITPLDPTVRSPEEDDIKLGFWGFQGHVNMGPLMKLTATWKPVYQSSVLLIDPVPMPEYVNFLDPDFPGLELKEGSYGLNFDLHAPVLDLSLYWFDGYMHWPGIAFDSFEPDGLAIEPQALNLNEKAYKIKSLGMDLSLPLGSWIIRGEGVWQQTTGSHLDHEYLPFPELSYTAEIERSGSCLTLLGGYYGKYILEYKDPTADPSLSAMEGIIKDRIGSFNRLYNYQLEEFYHTAFLVLKGNFWQDRLELSVPHIYNITSEEWIIQLHISWMPRDGIRIAAGYSGLFGPENSLYDMVGPVLNAGYLSLKVTF